MIRTFVARRGLFRSVLAAASALLLGQALPAQAQGTDGVRREVRPPVNRAEVALSFAPIVRAAAPWPAWR